MEKLKGNQYETTIFVVTSGITKMSKITAIPANRLLYRGLGGMILPRQFWDTYDECIVEVRLGAAGGAAASVLAQVKAMLLRKPAGEQAEPAMSKAFDLSVEQLQLPPDRVPEPLRDAVARGIRVVKGPQAAGESV